MERDDMCPTEMEEQTALLSWARLAQGVRVCRFAPEERHAGRKLYFAARARAARDGLPVRVQEAGYFETVTLTRVINPA